MNSPLKHLKGEARLLSLGALYMTGAVALGVGALPTIIEALSLGDSIQLKIAALIIFVVLILTATGVGLWKYQRWARKIAFILAIPELVIFPAGTALGAFILILLSDPGNSIICSTQYRAIIASTPHLRPKNSPRFNVILFLVIGFVITSSIIIFGLLDSSR